MWQPLLASLGITAFAYAGGTYRTGQGLSPDGDYYLRAASGQPVPAPYNRRLLPRLVGQRRVTWQIVSTLALLLTGPLVWLYTHSLAAVWLFAFLPMFHLNVRLPVLVDASGFALALGSALLWSAGQPLLAIGCAILAGGCKETAPVFAAVFAWSPWLLIGWALPLVFWRWRRAAPDQPWLERPFQLARKTRDPLDWRRVALPWGLCPLLLVWGNALAISALALGYAQLAAAQDDSRLYQWSAPALLALTPFAPHWLVVSMCIVQPFIVSAHRGT